ADDWRASKQPGRLPMPGFDSSVTLRARFRTILSKVLAVRMWWESPGTRGRFAPPSRPGLVMVFCLAGCAVASAPIKDTPQVVATPQNGQLTAGMQAAKAIGGVEPVYVSVANGTDEPRAIVPSQIFAINEVGERVAPLPPGEAARQAGGAGELKAALSSAAVSGAAAGAVGAGLGAIAGAGLSGAGTGALV